MVLAISSHLQASCLTILFNRKPSTNSFLPVLLTSRPWRTYHHFTHRSNVKDHLNFPQNLHKGNFGEDALLIHCPSHLVIFPEASSTIFSKGTERPCQPRKTRKLSCSHQLQQGTLLQALRKAFYRTDAKTSALVLRLSK